MPDTSFRTDDAILERLVVVDGVGITFVLVSLATKVFDSLVVQETIGVYTSSDLHYVRKKNNLIREETHDVLVIHLSPEAGAPRSKCNTSRNYGIC